jgi:hypothetical protein
LKQCTGGWKEALLEVVVVVVVTAGLTPTKIVLLFVIGNENYVQTSLLFFHANSFG